jgi:hypothetical protein
MHLVTARLDDSMENTMQVWLQPQKGSADPKNPVGDLRRLRFWAQHRRGGAS